MFTVRYHCILRGQAVSEVEEESRGRFRVGGWDGLSKTLNFTVDI